MTQIAGPFVLTVGAYPATEAELDTGPIHGRITAVLGKVTGTGGDLAIKFSGDAARPDVDILSESVSADFVRYPRNTVHSALGAAIANSYDAGGIPVYGSINIAVTNAAAEDEYAITFLLD